MHKTIISAVKCNSYDAEILSDKIRESVELSGGLPEKFKPGISVLLKLNLLTAKAPELSVTTHPELARAVIRLLKDNGITDITIGDSPAGEHKWEKLWEITGMKKIAEEENVKLIRFENPKMIFVDGDNKVPVLKEFFEFGGVISLPKLKTHILTKITGAVKNSYGFVIGHTKSFFHGKHPSPQKMSSFIAHVYGQLKPDFFIMDAIQCMEGDGPNTGKTLNAGIIFAGADGVAMDACACEVFGYKWNEIKTLLTASENNYGNADSSLIEKKGDAWSTIGVIRGKHSLKADAMSKIPEKLFSIVTLAVRCRPRFDPDKCVKCGVCIKACPQKAIFESKHGFKVKSSKCVLCMCCIESCPHHAIMIRSGGLWKWLMP
jgi:uncharacterized protein (DUF362 family)